MNDTSERLGVSLSIVTVFLTCCVGCWRDPYAASYTKNKPAPEAVAGTWSADDGTVLALGADGTFTLSGVSSDRFDESTATTRRATTSGQWSLKQRQDWWVVELHKTAVDGTRLDVYQEVNLLGQQPPYTLRHVLGDDDEGKGVSFKKSPASPDPSSPQAP